MPVIHRTDHTDENAIAISNALIDDHRLSPGALGLAIWMCGQQQRVGKDWTVPGPADLPLQWNDTPRKVKRCFAELVENGYVIEQKTPGVYALKPGLWKWPSGE
jgi:hypothetical protein